MLQVKYAGKMPNQSVPLEVRPVRAFTDNYIWLIESPRASTRLVAVDPGDAGPVKTALARSGASLAAILLTHHHPDHIGGVPELLTLGPVPVIGPDDERIPHRTQTVRGGERCELQDLGLMFDILAVPGHTLSHIAFWGHGALFCGDTLFSAGCGRMFEGTPAQMHASLTRLASLPEQTQMYCGHEYTAANLRFAQSVDPANAVELSDPHGLSGSLVWNTRRVECHVQNMEWSPDLAQLTGLLCRWDSPTSTVMAVRIETVLDFLARQAK